MKIKKTDNLLLSDKVALRTNHLPNREEVNVLDAFSANGAIWKTIKIILPDIKFNVVRLDSDVNRNGFYVKTTNERFLQSADLSRFDVIDLDAYGAPYKQWELLFSKVHRLQHTIEVFSTFNSIGMGRLPFGLLRDIGITRKMYSRATILSSMNRKEKIFGYLYNKGVREVTYRELTNHAGLHLYMHFTVGENT